MQYTKEYRICSKHPQMIGGIIIKDIFLHDTVAVAGFFEFIIIWNQIQDFLHRFFCLVSIGCPSGFAGSGNGFG